MTYTISTIDELKDKSTGELHAIFKNAANAAVMPGVSPQERRAAEITMANIFRTLIRPAGPG
jgi:hypothetical protein